MIEVLASSDTFFNGDFLFFGILGAFVWYLQSKRDEDFYE
jgi:hypothetical protein